MPEISGFRRATEFARPVNGDVEVQAEIAKFDEVSPYRRLRELNDYQERASLPSRVQLGNGGDSVRDELLVKLRADERETLDRLSDILSQAGFEILLCDANGNTFTPYAKSPMAQQAVGGLTPRASRRVREYIDAHLSEDINVQVLAALTGLSKWHFARAFKQSIGTTPHHYLMVRRLECAQKILIETELPLAQVASKSGFSDQSHFSHRFRRFFGVAPRSIRWAHR